MISGSFSVLFINANCVDVYTVCVMYCVVVYCNVLYSILGRMLYILYLRTFILIKNKLCFISPDSIIVRSPV